MSSKIETQVSFEMCVYNQKIREFFFFMCTRVCLSMGICTNMCPEVCAHKSEEGVGSPGTEDTGGCGQPCGC